MSNASPAPQSVLSPDGSLLSELEARSGVRVSACFQCHKCTAGCPLTFAMDIYPDALVHLVQLGARERVLSSKTIWVCSSCSTCVTRCPNGVDLPHLMDALKQLATEEGVVVPEAGRGLALIQGLFLEEVRRRGRIHELSLILKYKRQRGGLFDDLGLGWQMLRKGKLRLLPARIKGLAELQDLFKEGR